jgi:hypothetical protein
MESLLGLETAGRRARTSATFGLVRQLVKSEDDSERAPLGVLRIGEHTTVCRVEHLPAVGDLIHGTVSGIVETVRIARSGRISIVASPTPASNA